MTQAKASLEAMRVQNVELVRKNVNSQKDPYADHPLMRRLLTRVMEKYDAYSREQMGWEKWEPRYIAIYDRYFTEPQVLELLAFYKSDAGKAWIRAVPLIGNEMQEGLLEQSSDVDAWIASMMSETIEEVRAEVEKEEARQGAGR